MRRADVGRPICVVGIALFAALIAFPSFSEPLPENLSLHVTAGWLNGRMWLIMDKMERVFYVKGVADSADDSREALLIPPSSTTEEVVDGITQFYKSDTVNLPLPVISALRLYVMKSRGATATELDVARSTMLKGVQELKELELNHTPNVKHPSIPAIPKVKK